MRYRELVERREAPLYHNMNPEKAHNVFDTDVMGARWMHDVPGIGELHGNSFSRNPRFRFGRPVRVTVDQAAIMQHNRIIPLDAEYVYRHTYFRRDGETEVNPNWRDRLMNGLHNPFAEEFIIGDIKSFHRCARRVEILDITGTLRVMSDLVDAAQSYCQKWHITLFVHPKISERIQQWKEEWDDD